MADFRSVFLASTHSVVRSFLSAAVALGRWRHLVGYTTLLPSINYVNLAGFRTTRADLLIGGSSVVVVGLTGAQPRFRLTWSL